MRRILLSCACLMTSGLAAAGPTAGRAAWAEVMGPVLRGSAPGAAPHPALAELARVNFDTGSGLATLAPLIEALGPIGAPDLTPSAFAALDPAAQRNLLRNAAESASLRDLTTVKDLIDALDEGRLSPTGLPMAYQTADVLLASHSPYLGAQGRELLRKLRPRLLDALMGERSRHIADAADGIRRQIEPAPAAAPEAPKPIQIFPRVDDSPAEESADPQMRWHDPVKAAADRNLLRVTLADFGPAIDDAARRGDQEAFARASDAAYAFFHKKMKFRSLDYIRRHPPGPFARATLSALKIQLQDLEDHVERVGGRAGLLARRPAPLAILREIQAVEKAVHEPGRVRGRKAGEALARIAFRGDAKDGSIIAPLFEAADYYRWRVKEAAGNTDPYHLPEVRSKIRAGRLDGMPPVEHLIAAHRDALAIPGNSAGLERRARWYFRFALGFLLAAAALVLLPLKAWDLGLVSAAIGVPLFAAFVRLSRRLSRFQTLGAELRDLLRRHPVLKRSR